MRIFRLCALALALTACTRAPDEERIRTALAELETAVEAKQLGPVREHVLEQFSAQGGAVDRQAFLNLIRAAFLTNQSVEISISDIRIQIAGGRAEVSAKVLMLGGSGRLLPERGQVYAVDSVWRLDGDEWKVHQAEWQAGL